MRQNGWVITGYVGAVIAFIVLAVYMVLFATGYKFDWTTKSLKKTGFLLLETYPRGAEVKVAGRRSGYTATTVKRLLPGDYLVELDKMGYRSWSGTLKVQSGLVTEKRNTLLTFDELTPELVFDKPVELLRLTPDRSRAAIVVGNEVLLLNINNQTTSNILSPTLILQQVKGVDGQDLSTARITEMVFGPDNRMLLLSAVGRRDTYHLLLNTDTGQMLLVVKGGLIRSGWLNSNQITWAQSGKLYLQQVGDKTSKLINNSIIDYAIVEGTIYGITSDEFGKHTLVKVGLDGNLQKEVDDLPVAKRYQLIRVGSSWVLVTSNQSVRSIWVSERSQGALKWNKFASNVTSEVWWDSNHLVYIASNGLMVAETKKEIKEPIRVAATGNWHDIYFAFDTLLFAEQGKLYGIDVTGRNRYELVRISATAQVVPVGLQLSRLIYIGTDKKLYSVKLRDETTGLLNLGRFNSTG